MTVPMPETLPSEMGQNTNIMVGQRIRLLRSQQNLSLRTLAKRCGLSVNAISKIERGENSPTVASLHLLASALSVPITEFFQSRSDQRIVYVKSHQRLRSQYNGTAIESLGNGLRNQQLEPFLMTLQPHINPETPSITHGGQEFVYCLQGEVQYEIGAESFQLKPGDSLLFEADQPHRCVNPTDMLAVILLVFQSQEGTQSARQRHLDV